MKLFEVYNGLLESKASEAQGLNTLRKSNIENGESIIQQFAVGDESQHKKNIPIMAYIYSSDYNDIKNIIKVVNEYNDLEINKRVKPIQLTKNGIVIGGKTFTDFNSFSVFIKGESTKRVKKPESNGNGNISTNKIKTDKIKTDKPRWGNESIDIYEGDSVGKCIKYTQGGLTGKAYSFCIGQHGPSNLFKGYRDREVSTFYFIIDKTRVNSDGTPNFNDPLHIVVLDNTKNGIKLTDGNNTTGTIAEYGTNVDAYIKYLESKGVPSTIFNELSGEEEELMPNRPKTDQEDEEEKLLGNANDSLEWFMELPIEYKLAYIHRGHRLTNDQFDYLMGR